MAAPPRGNTGYSIYFITASTIQQRLLFSKEPMARLFIEVLLHYRDHKNYLLHEFVLMPDHIHLLISPTLSLERSLQLIKGGFSYRARKELGFIGAGGPRFHPASRRRVPLDKSEGGVKDKSILPVFLAPFFCQRG